MARAHRTIAASPERIFDVLRDGYSYAHWVVGTQQIREVDEAWPRAGTRLRYRAGIGPLRTEDETVALSYEPDRCLELEAKGWPAGTVRIELRAESTPGGSVVSIDEHPLRGPAKYLHNPLFDVFVWLRNHEMLRRLAQLAGDIP